MFSLSADEAVGSLDRADEVAEPRRAGSVDPVAPARVEAAIVLALLRLRGMLDVVDVEPALTTGGRLSPFDSTSFSSEPTDGMALSGVSGDGSSDVAG